MKTEIVCIGCPMGCRITVERDGQNILRVEGNGCPRGEKYARQECVAPRRVVTGSVPVRSGNVPVRSGSVPVRSEITPACFTFLRRVSVKTSAPVPKDRIFDVMAEIHAFEADLPVAVGDVLIPHVAGTDADVIATENA